MVVAAERTLLTTQEFDWDFAESQFVEDTDAAQRPEAETYGRSLGTIRRLGAFMLGRVLSEVASSPEAQQAKAEFYTSVEEGFGTDMELGGGLEVRDFDRRPTLGGRVMSKDLKTAISAMTEAGLKCAEETARNDRRFVPQLVRSVWDHENALTVDKMARGETDYNTRIVISPFPEEGAKQSGDAYWRDVGYVPHLRRGFVQLYHAGSNEIVTGSLSFDGSNRRQLRHIFGRFGIEIPEGEVTDNWLKYAITDTLSEDEAKALATDIADAAASSRYQKNTNTVKVTKQYKPIMERAFNEAYIHVCESLVRGHQTDKARELIFQLADKAPDFNERYARALHAMRADPNRFTSDDSIVLHELLVYSTIEMMRALHLQKTGPSRVPGQAHEESSLSAYLHTAEAASFQNILSSFGADGARNNRIYSACGLSIALGEDGTKDGPQAAFGGVDKKPSEDADDLGDRWFTCPKGHLNYRWVANVKEKNCMTCWTDISCKPPKPPRKAKTERNIGQILFGRSKNIENRTNKNALKLFGSQP